MLIKHEVQSVFRLLTEGRSMQEVCSKTGLTWREVGFILYKAKDVDLKPQRAVLTSTQEDSIITRYNAGESLREIIRNTGATQSQVCYVLYTKRSDEITHRNRVE